LELAAISSSSALNSVGTVGKENWNLNLIFN